MKASFFEQYGNEIEFQNRTDILNKLSNIDCSAPSRTKGRTREHKERYCLKKYLTQLCLNSLLKFPIKIKKDESPDFLITHYDNKTTALEITEATIEDYQRAKTEFKKNHPDSLFTYDIFKPGKKLPKGEYKKAILRPSGKLGTGWTEAEAAEEWIICCMSAIKDKTHKINEPHFKSADRYELLIYDGCPASTGCDIEDAMPSLKRTVNNEMSFKSLKRLFSCISVVQDRRLFYNVTNNILVLINGRQNFTQQQHKRKIRKPIGFVCAVDVRRHFVWHSQNNDE